jgi:hypothetical protein
MMLPLQKTWNTEWFKHRLEKCEMIAFAQLMWPGTFNLRKYSVFFLCLILQPGVNIHVFTKEVERDTYYDGLLGIWASERPYTVPADRASACTGVV